MKLLLPIKNTWSFYPLKIPDQILYSWVKPNDRRALKAATESHKTSPNFNDVEGINDFSHDVSAFKTKIFVKIIMKKEQKEFAEINQRKANNVSNKLEKLTFLFDRSNIWLVDSTSPFSPKLRVKQKNIFIENFQLEIYLIVV